MNTKKTIIRYQSYLLLCIPFAVIFLTPMPSKPSHGDELFQIAKKEETASNYQAAKESYSAAYKKFQEEKSEQKALEARYEKNRMEIILQEYPLSEADVEKKLFEAYKTTPKNRLDELLALHQLDFIQSDGKKLYFESCIENVAFRNQDIAFQTKDVQVNVNKFVNIAKNFIKKSSKNGGDYKRPKKVQGKEVLKFSKDDLPKSGILKLWLPIPITRPEQKILSITVTPAEFKKPLSVDPENYGVVYLEIPIKNVKKDTLKIVVRFSYESYEQDFHLDPEKISPYDEKSALYTTYTTSTDAITLTPAIYKRAQSIVGTEKNPLIKAKLIYDYIIKNVRYSLMPHAYLLVKHLPESQFVEKHHFGDCGSQAIYFSALCRAVGVPARAYGGYQLLVPGAHMWAQFYLENIGWIPVDPSVGSLPWLLKDFSASEAQRFSDYYFGHLDSDRMVIQSNLFEIPPNLPLKKYPYFTVATQYPLCYSDNDLEKMVELTVKKFKIHFKKNKFPYLNL